VIIASFALGDPGAIQDEDEFLMSLNRFNVMSSRAKAKLIVLVSRASLLENPRIVVALSTRMSSTDRVWMEQGNCIEVVESRSSSASVSPPVGVTNDNGVTRHRMRCSSYRDTKEQSRSSNRDICFPSHVRTFQARDICGSCTIGPSAETNSE
jgi:hypothetical protein